MTASAQALAHAVGSWFRRQRSQGRLGRASEFAKAIEPALLDCYLGGLRANKLRKADLASIVDDAVAMARNHARDLAKILNEGTESLSYSRTAAEVFGPDRAALIGVQEDDVARQRVVALVAKAKGEMLEWVNDGKPCPVCKKLQGKRRRPGKMFMVYNGEPIYHAPLHVSCRCKTKRVQA